MTVNLFAFWLCNFLLLYFGWKILSSEAVKKFFYLFLAGVYNYVLVKEVLVPIFAAICGTVVYHYLLTH